MRPSPCNDLTTRHGKTPVASGHPAWSSSSTPTRAYSTCWVPLEGIIQDWLDVAREAALAIALAAAGAALFALSHEKRALHCYTQGWQDSWREAAQQAQEAFHQTGEHLAAAAQHWSLVVTLLDTLPAEQPQAVPADELGRIRALAHTAREQRERLYQLAEEVHTDLAAAAQPAARAAASRSPLPHQQQQEGRPWPSA
jgi:hypothetical protein